MASKHGRDQFLFQCGKDKFKMKMLNLLSTETSIVSDRSNIVLS